MKHARIRISATAICLAVLLLVDLAAAMQLDEVQEVTASDAADDDFFGEAVALSGNVAVVGAPEADGTGTAYIYRHDGTSWVEEQELAALDVASGDLFGGSVAIDGDVALIGALNAREGGEIRGAAYVFRYDGSDWIEEQRLVADDGVEFANFGERVALQADAALIGARFDTELGNNSGAAYVYRFDGAMWAEEQKLTASDGAEDDLFGGSVCLDGDVALVGATSRPGGGAVYAYRFDGSSWVEDPVFVPTNPQGSEQFGASVALHGDLALVGAPSAGSDNRGAAYLFRYDGTTWVEEQMLRGDDSGALDRVGRSVALNGDVALIGAPVHESGRGAVYLYRLLGSTWEQQQKITASEPGTGRNFGNAVSLGQAAALIGAPGARSSTGAALAFEASCLAGTVNDGNGLTLDTIFIAGSNGGGDRTVTVNDGDLIRVTVLKPLTGGSGRFVLHADAAEPNIETQAMLPFDIGVSCFPFLLNEGATPVIIANNLGRESYVGESEFLGFPVEEPERATTEIAYPPLPVGTCLTFQGVIFDPASASSRGVSTTNAVILKVLP